MSKIADVEEKGLPVNLDAERFVLGAVMADEAAFIQVAGALTAEDFSLEKHRRIFGRMLELHERGENIDRVTVANELMKQGQLDSVDGLTYLVSLDDGLPAITNLDSYVRIVKEKALLRGIIFTSQALINRAARGQDQPERILAAAEESFMRLAEAKGQDSLMGPRGIIEESGGINVFLDPTKRRKGITTGFPRFDEMTGGLHEGELIVLAGRPAMGKTALAMNIAQHVAMHPHSPGTVAVFSLEMSRESLLTRMVCAEALVDQQKFRAGFVNQEERRRLQAATNAIAKSPLFIDDSAGVNILDIHAKVRRLRAEHGLALVVIDYLQLMSAGGRYENRNAEIGSISRGFKLLAKELKVPVLALSQLSRSPETRPGDHRPQISDLRESGSIEQDADLVGFIYREEVYKPDREDLKGMAELLISKQRNGPTGRVKLVFLKEFTKFENLAEGMGF